MAPRKTRTQVSPSRPTEATEFSFAPAEGYSDSIGPDEGGWVTLTPAPKGNESKVLHVYIRPEDYHTPGQRLEWYSNVVSHQQGADIEFNTYYGSESAKVDYDKRTITFAEPLALDPPPRTEDTQENQKLNQRHTRAMKGLLDACLVGTKRDLIKLIQAYDNPVTATIRTSMSEAEVQAEVDRIAEARAAVQPIHDALKGIEDTNERKALLRHVAHVFDIPKGDTSLR